MIGVNTPPDTVNRLTSCFGRKSLHSFRPWAPVEGEQVCHGGNWNPAFSDCMVGRAEMGLSWQRRFFHQGLRQRQRLADRAGNFTTRCCESPGKAHRPGVFGRGNTHTGLRQAIRFPRFPSAAGRLHSWLNRSVRRRRPPADPRDRSLPPTADSKHTILLRARCSGRSKRYDGTCSRCRPCLGRCGTPYGLRR